MLFVGPVMIYAAVQPNNLLPPFWRWTLGILGASTIAYNGVNFIRHARCR